MNVIKRLPDAEFEIMKIIWHFDPPITTLQIMDNLGSDKNWKAQTVLTMLVRLGSKGFISSERVGKQRSYTPLISEKEYFQIETGDFLKRYSGNSVGSLVKALHSSKELSDEDMNELREWLSERM